MVPAGRCWNSDESDPNAGRQRVRRFLPAAAIEIQSRKTLLTKLGLSRMTLRTRLWLVRAHVHTRQERPYLSFTCTSFTFHPVTREKNRQVSSSCHGYAALGAGACKLKLLPIFSARDYLISCVFNSLSQRRKEAREASHLCGQSHICPGVVSLTWGLLTGTQRKILDRKAKKETAERLKCPTELVQPGRP